MNACYCYWSSFFVVAVAVKCKYAIKQRRFFFKKIIYEQCESKNMLLFQARVLIASNQIETIFPVEYKDTILEIPIGSHMECHIRQYNHVFH